MNILSLFAGENQARASGPEHKEMWMKECHS